jgi:outer membrane protein assembly factor BamB
MKRQPLALLLVGAVAVTALLGSRTSWFGFRSDSQSATAEWSAPNRDLASTRATPGASLSGPDRPLRVRWRFRLRGKVGFSGVFASTPVVSGGRVYIQDLNSNVSAVSLGDGILLWTHRYDRPDGGPNGVTVSGGMIVGNTDTTAFALDAGDGSELWQRRLTSSANPITIAPTVANGTVYTSSTGQAPGGRGAIYALDLSTGRVKWRFDTIAEPWRFPKEASGGGAWYPPSVDSEGRVYVGISNPYPWGGSRRHPNGGAYAGPARYTDSLVVLDGKTGKLLWSDQVTPHDVRDYDFQLSPILQGGTVIGAGKAGRVVAWSQSTHERLWQTPVGTHRSDLGPLPRRRVSVCPGLLGGAETPMAYADGRVFVPVVNLCFPESALGSRGFSFFATDYSKGTGELVALDASTGSRLWRRAFSSPNFGCATVAGDVVFSATYDGNIYGLSTRDGSTVLHARTRAGINGCPAVAGDTLLVGAGTDHPAFPSPVFELIAYAIPSA